MRAVLRARREAQRVLAEADISGPPVPIEKIARGYAQVMKREIPSGISGMLVPVSTESEWIIVVNNSDHPVRQRFTIAHELGHCILHGYTTPHADSGYKLRCRDARSSDGSILEEIEANQFAAELLMPEKYVLEAIEREGLDYDPSIDDESLEVEEKVGRIARRFNVSKQAMLIRISSLMA
jgi:Zn-dependent peptidase ImmA (M78 family)